MTQSPRRSPADAPPTDANHMSHPHGLADSAARSVLSYAELESAINALADGVSIYDRQFRVLYQNRVIIDLYGPALWERCHLAYHKRGELCPDCPSIRTLGDGGVHSTIRKLDNAGEPVFVEIRSSPILNARGEVAAVAEVTRDITERETIKLKLEQALQKVTAQQRQIETDLALAQTVHASLIPRSFHDHRMHIHVQYVPVQSVGGDYADIVAAGDDLYYTIIFDISGHGIAPALLANRVSGEIHRMLARRPPPADLLAEVNAFLLQHFNETGLYLTFFCCRYDMKSRTLTYSGGGHLPAVLLRKEGRVRSELLRSQNGILGAFEHAMSRQPQTSIEIRPGDKVVLFTDGIVEAGQSLGIPMTLPGVVALYESLFDFAPGRFSEIVIDQITHRMGTALDDDITLLITEVA